jgi:hypothetical protein
MSDIAAQLALLGIAFDENSALTYVIATATQANSLNQDLNGVAGNVNSSLTWSQLGVLSNSITPAGMAPVPEINPAMWIILLLGAAAAQRSLANRRRAKRKTVLLSQA